MNGSEITVAAALLLVSAQGLSGQVPAPISAGAKVRYTAHGSTGEPTVGTVLSVERDTLFLAPSKFGEPYAAVALESLSRLEVARVTGNKSTTGAALGLAAGALIGGALGFLAGEMSNATERECTGGLFTELRCTEVPVDKSGEGLVSGALLGGLAGGFIGAYIGSTKQSVRWEPVALEDVTLAIAADSWPGITIAARVGG